jgi:hypothetical protein
LLLNSLNVLANFFTDELEGEIVEVNLFTNFTSFLSDFFSQLLDKVFTTGRDRNVSSLDFSWWIWKHFCILELIELVLEIGLELFNRLVINLELFEQVLNKLVSLCILFIGQRVKSFEFCLMVSYCLSGDSFHQFLEPFLE